MHREKKEVFGKWVIKKIRKFQKVGIWRKSDPRAQKRFSRNLDTLDLIVRSIDILHRDMI